MNQDTFERVRRVISGYVEDEAKEVRAGSHLTDDLGLDSLAALEIVFDLEEEFGIIVPEERIPEFTTIEAVCRASPFRISTPRSAALPTPTTRLIGVARPRAQGQAITSTVTAAITP